MSVLFGPSWRRKREREREKEKLLFSFGPLASLRCKGGGGGEAENKREQGRQEKNNFLSVVLIVAGCSLRSVFVFFYLGNHQLLFGLFGNNNGVAVDLFAVASAGDGDCEVGMDGGDDSQDRSMRVEGGDGTI